MSRAALVTIIGVHALIHLIGFGHAFRLWTAAALTAPISRPWGVTWLLAALLLGTSALGIAVGHGRWWLPAALGLVVSQAAITAAWTDAKAGTILNVAIALLLLAPAIADPRR